MRRTRREAHRRRPAAAARGACSRGRRCAVRRAPRASTPRGPARAPTRRDAASQHERASSEMGDERYKTFVRPRSSLACAMLLPSAASRRAVLHGLALLAASQVPASRRAIAFENRLPPDELELKYKTPRTPGPKPQDLGTRQSSPSPGPSPSLRTSVRAGATCLHCAHGKCFHKSLFSRQVRAMATG